MNEEIQAADQAAESVTYHFILTCTWTDVRGRGQATNCLTGVIRVKPGTTRDEAYEQIRRDAATCDNPIPAEAVTLFFSLEPNAFGGAR